MPPGGDPAPASEAGSEPRWQFKQLLAVAVPSFLIIFVVNLVVVAVVVAFLSARGVAVTRDQLNAIGNNPRVIVPAMFLAYLAVLAWMYFWVATSIRAPFWRVLQWNWPRRWPAFIAAGIGLAWLGEFASNYLPIPKTVPMDRFFTERAAIYWLLAFGVTLAPLVEELFFRGFLYPALAWRAGMLISVLITAAAFALIHAPQLAHAWAPLLILFVVGIAFTLARALARSVAASLLMHVAYNGTLFSMLYVATDHFQHLERLTR